MCGEPLITEAQTKSGIDVQALTERLSEIKLKKYPNSRGELTSLEISYLCLFLAGYSKGEIAYRIRQYKVPTERELLEWADLDKQSKNLTAQMSHSIHAYIKEIIGLTQLNAKLPNLTTTIERLKAENYGLATQQPTASSTTARLIVEGNLTSEQLTNALRQLGINATVSQVIEDESSEK
jgi:hypothetical protein